MDLGLARRKALVALLRDPLGVAPAVEQVLLAEGCTVVDQGDDVDVVVAVCTGGQPSSLDQLDDEQWDQAWSAVDGIATRYHAAIGGMRERGWGRLIYVGSATVKEVADGDGDDLDRIVALGVLGLQKTVAGELGPDGITANSVLAGSDGVGADDVAAVVAYLASEAAGFVTGVTITVDGGTGRAVF